MIISKKKYEAAIREEVDRQMADFWKAREKEDQQRHYSIDLLKLHNEIRDLQRMIGNAAADLAKRFGDAAMRDTTCNPY